MGAEYLDFSWMAWTWQTATFFSAIALLLVGMMVWEWWSPGGGPRRGIFGLDTTRGDRLFISLLGSAFLHLLWLGFVDLELFWASILALAFSGVVFRWG
jgi:predicted small integral membrane protein